jgi:signal transduction histidine kinase
MRLQDYLEGKTDRYEAHYRMVTKSGKIQDVMGRGRIVRYDEEGKPIRMAGLISDVSEKKKLDDELNKIHNLESIGLLAGGLAHDFNNVLNVIYGNISFARMLVGGNTAIVEPLTDAEEACERAKELGIRLQAFSRGNAPAREAISLPAIIEQVGETLFKGSNILPTVTVADDLFPVEADPRQIRQVFENLLTNAKEAMVNGGTVKIDMENYQVDRKNILPIASGSYLRIAIQDSGQGIPAENLTKIFDPYFSTKDTYSQKGLGLGLSICHAILKRHHGHISVESTVGVGTLVTFYLPASRGASKFAPEGGE